MSYEELVESRKNIGDMTKEELFTYCGGLLNEVWDYDRNVEQLLLDKCKAELEIERLNNIIKEAIKYIKENTSDGYIIVDDLNYYDIPELLRILQGSEKE